MRHLPLALCLLLAVGASGCVTTPGVQLNHAEINGVQMAAFPPRLGVLLTIVVDITNSNSFDIGVRGVRGQVMMSERYPLAITYQPPPPGIWLRAGQATPMRIPIEVPVDLALALVREALASQVIPFHLTGQVDVTGTSTLQVKQDNFPVDLRGTVTRQQIEGAVPSFLMHR